MHKQLPTWQLILHSLQQNIPVMLLYVIESKGSSPGRQGFCMAVNAAGNMHGSLGGGIMEHKFVELAKSKLEQPVEEVSLHQQLHDKAAAKNQSGMICSGRQTIFLYTVHANESEPIASLIRSLEQAKNGTLQLSPKGIIFTEDMPPADYRLEILEEQDFLYIEKAGYKNQLYIVGGGHCALSLSQLMCNMDFHIHLIDHRAGLHTIERNHFAHNKIIVDDYSILPGLVPDGNNIYVVVMTVGYRTDQVALRALLNKQVKFIGVLGSKTKVKKMFKDLIAEGITPGMLAHIHAPVGLSIKSRTTEEIAVSIAGEIIQVKNKDI